MNLSEIKNNVVFSQKLAVKIGVEEAVLLQQLHQQLLKHGLEKEGHVWYCQTYRKWAAYLDFWNEQKIRRLLLKLEHCRLVISSTKFNVINTDRTKWYRIDYELFKELLNSDIAE